jgi:CubicO group peptidase (beta-lactamase class C family)
MRRIGILLLFILGHCASAVADDAPARLVAGYKALFTCSATFLAGRTPEQIARNDLSGIYRDYEAVMARLPDAVIDRENGTVSVAWPGAEAPAVARLHGPLGCAVLPANADKDMALPTPATSAGSEPDAAAYWPEGDRLPRPPTGPNSAGSPLARVMAQAFDGETFGTGYRTSAVVVLSGGELIAEAYLSDSGMHVPQRTWSVAKTIMGALVGIAIGDGLLRVEEPAPIPQWSAAGDPRAAIRIADLLHMASGLDAGTLGSRTDEVYFGGARVEDAALNHALFAPPGSRWNYANNDTLALSHALRVRLGNDARYLAWPYEKLFHPIGMRHTTAETDWHGTFILSSQVWTTARDLARFGQLLLDDGMWNGRRVLPEGWVRFMTAPAPMQPPPRADESRGPGYGAQVWLFGAAQDLPQGTFAAIGNRGQFIIVVPSARMVIVRRGYDPETGPFRIERFAAAVLEAANRGD